MKKKKMLFLCGVALTLALGIPQMTGEVLAKSKPIPIFQVLDVVPNNGFIVSEVLHQSPFRGGSLYGYRAFEPDDIQIIRVGGKKFIRFYYHFLAGAKLKDYGENCVDIDLSTGTYREIDPPEWRSLQQEVNTNCTINDENNGCWNYEITRTVNVFLDYLKTNRPEIYNEVMDSIRENIEKQDSSDRERLNSQLDTAYQNAQAGLETIATIGTDVTWESFSSEYVDNSKVPPLSELMGHVFLLSDSYGFKTVRMNNSIVLKTDKRRNALVHFLPIKHPDGYWMISLMDDTGEFAGKEYINRKPIVVRFRAYQEDYGYYKGMDDRFIKTGSFNTLGSVVGGANLVEGLTNEGYVNIGIEKTDEAGKYRLVYYVTRITWDDYGNQHVITNKQDGYYATLTLVK